jgi:uncharacterized protein
MHRFLNIGLSLIVIFSLASCTSNGNNITFDDNKITEVYNTEPQSYLAMAANKTGVAAQELKLLAAGSYIHRNQWQNAEDILTQILPLAANIDDEKKILLAKINVIKKQPGKAIALLANLTNTQNLSDDYQAQFHEVLACAYQLNHNPTESIIERVKLSNLLHNTKAVDKNNSLLWRELIKLPAAELDTLSLEVKAPTLAGWLKLAKIANNNYKSAASLEHDLQSWQESFPSHPGNLILNQAKQKNSYDLYAIPKKVALILPLQGSLKGPADAIKDGFRDAYQNSGAQGKLEFKVYDSTNADIVDLYNHISNSDVDFIIGPLTKNDVKAVSGIAHRVPTILLNDADGNISDNAYELSLSPKNEALQVAFKARKDGLSKALIIAPDSAWGDEVLANFAAKWRDLGGDIVDVMHYSSTDTFTESIRTFLRASNVNFAKTYKHRKETVDYTTLRRNDFDVIFLLAYPSQARQIMSFLRYYYAGDIPVYATSSVYSGSESTLKDKDLNGITFSDIPWVFTHRQNNHNWPEQFNSYNRLYALGIESFALTYKLNQLIIFPAINIPSTGEIMYLSDNKKINPIMTFGKFINGSATAL